MQLRIFVRKICVLDLIFLNLCVCVHVCVWVMPEIVGIPKGQRHQIPVDLMLQVGMSCLARVLGTKPGL